MENRKLVLWQNHDAAFLNDQHRFYGFGIGNLTLNYNVPAGGDHVFYSGTSSTNSVNWCEFRG